MNRSPRAVVKAILHATCVALTSPAVLSCAVEKRLDRRSEHVFSMWTQIFSILPGPLGGALRRAFYCGTLDACSPNCFIGFGSLFTHRDAVVEEGAYVGCYALIGSAILRKSCLVGSRTSLLSGPCLHGLNAEGQWTASDHSRLQQIEIGEFAWIGEATVVMSSVGAGSMVAAGSVVSSNVPPGLLVGGNPARYVRKILPDIRESTPRAVEQTCGG